MLTALANIGAIYGNKMVTTDKALDYDLKALEIAERLDDSYSVGNISANIGNIYFSIGNDSLALDYYRKSLSAHRGTENEPIPLLDIAKVYLKNNDFFNAIHNQTQAYEISKKLNLQREMSQALHDLGETYAKSGDPKKSIPYFEQALEIAEELNSKVDLSDNYEGLSKALASVGNYKDALHYQSLLSSIKDTLYNIEFDQKMSGQIFNYEIEKKQNEIALLNKDKELQELDIKRQKFAKNAFMVGLGLILIIAFIILRMYFTKVKTK